MFENLVVAEVIKARDHFRLDLQLWFWRTKDGEELDLLVQFGERRLFIEVKLAIQGIVTSTTPRGLIKEFPGPPPTWVVSFGGALQALGENCFQVPIAELTAQLVRYFGDISHSPLSTE
jgi:hypothetical protein